MNTSKINCLMPQLKVAADIALKYFGNVARQEKKSGDLVTIADQEIEEYLAKEIFNLYPDDGLIGEEGHEIGSKTGDTWIVDPIDGTADFANNLPSWAISVALMREQEIIEACVMLPALNKTYTAFLGQGSYLNAKSIKPRIGLFDKNNFFATKSGSHLRLNMNLNMRMATYPTAITPCLVADGSVLGSVSTLANIWDFAAAILIAKEAGVTVEYHSGKEFKILDLLDRSQNNDFLLFGSPEFIEYARKNCSIKT